jgi:putative ATPase
MPARARSRLIPQAEALATSAPLPGVPLQIRNAPTKLMKKLGYGKHYSYNPDFAHPVFNVSSLSL